MDIYDILTVVLVMVVVSIIMLATGFIVGYYANDEVNIKIVEKEVFVLDLDSCLEHVKDSDLFQRELFEKEWLE